MNVYRDTVFLQFFTSHQNTTVILHHTSAVAINIMQRKHHSHPDCTVAHVAIVNSGLRLHRLNRLFHFRIRNENIVTFLEFIVGHIHFRVSLAQLLLSDAVLFCNAIDGLFLLHFVHLFPCFCLCRQSCSH